VPHTAEAATVNGTELAVELRLIVCGIGGARGVWKLKMSEEGVQFISGLFDTFKVTGMALFDVEVPLGVRTVFVTSMNPCTAGIETRGVYCDGQSLRQHGARRTRHRTPLRRSIIHMDESLSARHRRIYKQGLNG
jgi:hypothetical protein